MRYNNTLVSSLIPSVTSPTSNQERKGIPVTGISMSLSGLVATLLIFSPVQTASAADDYLNTVVNELQEASVYVEPGIPGTDANTEAELDAHLKDGDGLILVMLPVNSQVTNPGEFAHELSNQLGDDDVIGLTIGDDAYAYSAVLPTGVASDLMSRAQSVSTNSEETLVTFTRNVHQYETEHPSSVAIPDHDNGSHLMVWTGGGLVLVLALIAAAVAMRRRRDQQDSEQRIKLRSPEGPRGRLEEILDLRKQIEDYDLQQAIWNCCNDLEKYFSKYSTNRQEDAITFENHLSSVVDVLKQYIEVQDNMRYYRDPEKLLASGKQAIVDFGEYVLNSCMAGSRANLARYTVKTQILQAQRYS